MRADGGAAGQGVFRTLQHQEPGSLAYDEAVPVDVEGAAGRLGIVAPGGDGLELAGAGDQQPGADRFGAARDDDVAGPGAEHLVGGADGDGAGGAGGGDGLARAEGAEVGGDAAGRAVDDGERGELGRPGVRRVR